MGSDEAVGRMLAIIEDHRPDIGSDIDDSTWLTCSCGWDSSKSRVDWQEHLVEAVRKVRPSPPSTVPPDQEVR